MTNPLQNFRPESLGLLKESQEDYWRYARKGPTDFSVYTEKSSIYKTPVKEKFREASLVLVRWTDGLFYLANIIKVEEDERRCAVKFEDGSQFYALYKDIFKASYVNNEIVCTVCDSGSSQPPDEIVMCDHCSMGYHQLCHIPKIETSVLRPDVTWKCRNCIFALTTRKGGAVKKGPHANALMVMKRTLPYDLSCLVWDSSHRSNVQQTYCYCGGPGEWFKNMLQCIRCKQWFHEACLQCLEEPILFGDRFYVFVCCLCNKGQEFLQRLPLRWPEIAHLVLFNLTVIHNKKFFDLDTTIMTFVKNNWSQFQVKGEHISRKFNEERKGKMLEVLQSTKSRFVAGSNTKHKSIWGLRNRVPPPAPVVSLPDCDIVTNEVLKFLNLSSSSSSSSSKKDSKHNRSSSQPKIQKSFVADDLSSSSKSFQRNEKGIEKNQHRDKRKKDEPEPKRKEKRKLPERFCRQTRSNSARKFTQDSPNITMSDDEDTNLSQGMLNAVIPQPTNFEGQNNPFSSGEKPSKRPKWSNQIMAKQILKNCHRRIRKKRLSTSSSSSTSSLVHRLLTDSLPSCSGKLFDAKANSSIGSYFATEEPITNGHKYTIAAKRTSPEGKVQYLIQWEGEQNSKS